MARLRVFSVLLAVIAAVVTFSFVAQADDPQCKDVAAKVDALEKRIAALEQNLTRQLQAIDKKIASSGAAGAGQAQANEAEAQAAYGKINGLISQGNLDQAKSEMADFMKKYGSTNTARRAQRTYAELLVIGKPAPTDWGISMWFQGEKDVDLAGDKTTLLVFWETWCPHCQREVPKLQAMYDSLHGDGLQVVGLTKVTKSSTDEKVSEFIEQQKVGYPVAKENGTASQHFNVSGIPAAAVIKGGKVIWRGHPARLNEDQLRKWL